MYKIGTGKLVISMNSSWIIKGFRMKYILPSSCHNELRLCGYKALYIVIIIILEELVFIYFFKVKKSLFSFKNDNIK